MKEQLPHRPKNLKLRAGLYAGALATSAALIACGGGSNETSISPTSTPQNSDIGLDIKPTATQVPVVPTPELSYSPEQQRLMNFYNKVVKDEYKVINFPDINLRVDQNLGSKTREPVGRALSVNGASFFPVEVEGPDGKFWGNTVQVTIEGISDNGLEAAKNFHNTYFKRNGESGAEWKALGNGRYERVILEKDGSFISEVAYFTPAGGIAAVCLTTESNPRYARKSCF